jgi:hypothetical protein
MRWRWALTAVYAVAAVGLVPWVVTLWWVQRPVGVTHHAALLTSILLGTVYVAALIAVGAATIRPRRAAIAACVGVTVAVTATVFHLVTTGSRGGAVWRGVGFAALMVVTLAAGWLVDALTRQRVPGRVQLARMGLIIGLALLIAPAVQLVRITPAMVPVSHLRLPWVALDVAEVLGLAATAWCAWRRPWWGVIAGSVTAGLLFTDAVRDVLATAGSAQTQAVAMSAVEVPLAVGAIVVAVLVPRRPAGCEEAGVNVASGRLHPRRSRS